MTTDFESTVRSSGFGSSDATAYGLYNGFNHQDTGELAPVNRDQQGFIFFTRPALNLTTENLRVTRKLHYLTRENSSSLGCLVRSTLMPTKDSKLYENITRSEMIDDDCPFITFLTNSITSLSGWPDEVTEIWDSPEGLAKQVHGIVDDRPVNYGTYELTASFLNREGDPHTVLFSAWREYMTRVSEGSMVPFPTMIAEDTIDYSTRIYALVLDSSKTYVQKIACTGAAYPKAVPTASGFNYNREQVFDDENTTVDIPFKCYGALYNDPRIILDFNRVAVAFNAQMDDSVRESNLVKLTTKNKLLFNRYGYPRIDPDTLELEWWVTQTVYDTITNSI